LTFSLSDIEFGVDELLEMKFEDHPLPFLTRDDVFFEGSSTILAAREKVGKSTLMRHVVYTWAAEGHRVLYLSEEWRRAWRRQAEELAFESGGGWLRVVEALGQDPAKLLDRAVRGSENVVVIDTLTWLLGVSLGNRDEIVDAIRPWLQLCRAGKTLIMLGHLTKRGSEIGGSYALAAAVDTLIKLRGVDGQDDLRVIEVRSRWLADSPVRFSVRKQGSTFTVEDVPGELQLTATQEEILVVLDVDPAKAKTVEDLMALTGFKESRTKTGLRQLVDLQLIRDVSGNAGGTGGRGNAAKYIAIEEEPEA
jgi:predicted ATP-dependent serine protease